MTENEFTDEIAVTENVNDNVTENVDESVDEVTEVVDVQEKKNKSRKITVLVTYLITVACLLAGLLVPLYNWGYGTLSERMLLRYLPSMLDNVLAPFAKKQLIPATIPWFLNVYTGKFDLASLACVLYALLCVVSLFMIIPVCLGKKHKKTSVNCALAVEIAAVIITAVYVVYVSYYLANLGAAWTSFNMLIPLGGALITAIIQSILTKGSLGVSKTIGVVLSTLAVVSILDITVFVPLLTSPLNNLSIKLYSGAQAGFFGGLDASAQAGINGAGILYHIKDAAGIVFGSGAYIGTLYVLIILLAVLTLFNFACDTIGLAVGRKYKKDGLPARNAGLNIFTLVRYSATLVFAVLLIILGVMKQGVTPGIYLYLLTVLMLFALINAVVRTVVEFARAKKCATNIEEIEDNVAEAPDFEPQPEEQAVYSQPVYEPVYEQPEYQQPVAEQQPVYEQPAYEQPAAEQPVYEQPAEQQPAYEQPVYEETIYLQPQYQQPQYQQQPAYEQPNFDRSAYDRSAYERPSYDRSSLYRQPAYEQSRFDDFEPEEEPDYEEPVKEEPAKSKAKQAAAEKPEEKPAPAPAPAPETIYVYSGDTDEFLDTLTEKEKVEFVEVFIKKSKGTVNGVPDYHIKGDNADFFPAVFVHINRYRDKLSDALMGKMYKQLGR